MSVEKIEQGSWVQIHTIVLNAKDRTAKLPDDTKKVDLEMWVKGFLKETSLIGEQVEIETITGRVVEGTLVQANPTYQYGFGDTFIPELLQIGIQARKILKEEI